MRMGNLNDLVPQAIEQLMADGHEELAAKLKKAMEMPELRISTKSGDLIVSTYDDAGKEPSANVMLDIPEMGVIDLYCAKGDEDGNILTYNWDDVFQEDYTTSSKIPGEDIAELIDYIMKDESPKEQTENQAQEAMAGIKEYPVIDEAAIDEICADFEALKYGMKDKVILTDTQDRQLLVEATRNFDKERFANGNIDKTLYDDGYGDLYNITSSLIQPDGSCIVLSELQDIPITELYNEMLEIAGIETALVLEEEAVAKEQDDVEPVLEENEGLEERG